jgi:hypothetical protein
MVKGRSAAHVARAGDDKSQRRSFSRVVVIVVALEHYRTPSNGDALPSVDYARADADSFAAVIRKMFEDMPASDVDVRIIVDEDASLTALRDEVGYVIKQLCDDDLFIFYYAGHGFHSAGGNRLSAYDTNRTNVDGTSFRLQDDLLELLVESECRQALVFVDACAEKFRNVISTRDVISSLDPDEVREFLDSGWYCGVFLSCSPGEKSYPSNKLGHGVWTHFLLEAMSGRAHQALTQDRWLTDSGLRDYLRREVPRYITREMQVRGSQTPQAIISATNSFRIRHVARPHAMPPNAALAGIKLLNNSEFLEGTEVGEICRLDGFQRNFHSVPDKASDSADSWCHRLLFNSVSEELQAIYQTARKGFELRRSDIRKEHEDGGGDLDTPAFRYSIETGQNPDDPAEYIIRRRLELRQGWLDHRAAVDELFGETFDRLVIEFESMDETFDELVEKLEQIREEQGGTVDDDDRTKRVIYVRDGASFAFDLKKRRLEISFNGKASLDLVESAQQFQLGIERSSSMLPGPVSAISPSPDARTATSKKKSSRP